MNNWFKVMTRSTNILRAQYYAHLINASNDTPIWQIMGRTKDGLVGDDSAFTKGFWRVGGNAVVYESGGEYRAARWHDFKRDMRDCRIFILIKSHRPVA
jgi:hypothetical protein